MSTEQKNVVVAVNGDMAEKDGYRVIQVPAAAQIPEPEDTIDLKELWDVLVDKMIYLIIACVIGAMAAGSYTMFLVTPLYKANSMIYVYSKTTSITSLTDLQIGSQLAVDFQIVATTDEVLDSVIARMGLNTTAAELLRSVSITNPSGSHILKIEVTNPNPVLAADISNALADELRARIADVMNTDEPSSVHKAKVPERKDSPSVMKNTALGGIGCAVVLAAFFVAAYLLDDTVKNAEDLEKHIGVNVMADIPMYETDKKKRKSEKG